jgi:hypothetical protein
MPRQHTATPPPSGGPRKPNLDGLFDDKTPPLVIRRRRRDWHLDTVVGNKPKRQPKLSDPS